MALLGENVDRAFWTLGPGGVGQSLFTTLIHNDISPNARILRLYIAVPRWRTQKTLEHIVGFRVLTAQEGTEGGSANIRNIRQDLYKKIALATRYPVDSRTLKVARWYRSAGCYVSSLTRH